MSTAIPYITVAIPYIALTAFAVAFVTLPLIHAWKTE
jgi:hypothetical protein